MKTKTNYRWLITVVLISIAATMFFTFASSEVLGYAGYVVALVVLAVFVLIGIVFDMIGIAVAAATEAPFHSMATHRERGATESLRLIKNADKVTGFCNDVVGDVCGIISGATAALIATRLASGLNTETIVFPLLISGAVTGLTVGGKAAGKTFAFNNSTKIVLKVGKLLNLLQPKKSSK